MASLFRQGTHQIMKVVFFVPPEPNNPCQEYTSMHFPHTLPRAVTGTPSPWRDIGKEVFCQLLLEAMVVFPSIQGWLWNLFQNSTNCFCPPGMKAALKCSHLLWYSQENSSCGRSSCWNSSSLLKGNKTVVVEGTSYLAFRKWPLSWLLVMFLFCLFTLFLLFQFCLFPLSWPLYLGPWLCPTKKVPSVALAHPFEPETLANSNSIALIILMCHATIILPWYVKQHSPNNPNVPCHNNPTMVCQTA